MSSYNKYYQKRDYFGKPYPELLEYFSRFDRKLIVLDLGCGQGRDVLALGRLGFTVKGIDTSSEGIRQLSEIAKQEKLPVTTEIMDYHEFNQLKQYDIILMNSMFHFYKNDIDEETSTINTILKEMKNTSKLVLIVQENKARIKHLKSIIDSSKLSLSIDYETSLIYKEFNSAFYLISIHKNQ